jgi:subtilisin family serine protease
VSSLLPLLASLLAFATPTPAPDTALVQIVPAHTRAAAPLLRQAGGTEIGPELRIWRVPAAAVPALRRTGIVAFSEPEQTLTSNAVVPADPLVDEQYWRASVGADRATPPGPGKPVTIVDSGLDVSHPEFASRPNTTLLNSQTVRAEDDDHGTEVSSVIAAPENGIGLVGIYPLADLRSWDASPNGFLSDGAAIQGILEAARRGPGLINLSFGGPIDDRLLKESILAAVRAGSVVVAASGNEGIQGSPESFPADYAHVLTVGATDDTDAVADFSTTSPWLDLVAPGVEIPVAEPTFNVPGGFVKASGTSFSAPMVAGAGAWVWTVRPQLDSSQLFEIMRRSARDIGAPGWDLESGYGVLDIPSALSRTPPVRDPFEPNDDADQIEPGRMFTSGMPSLTTAKRGAAAVTARVDRREDPHDFYRVLVPAGRRLGAHTSGPVDLRIYRRAPRPLRKAAVATSARAGSADEQASYTNTGARPVYVYVEVRPGKQVISAQYSLRVTTTVPR